MKKILILILLVSSFKLMAQHPDLQQRWYVQSITINSVTTVIPNDPIELPYVYIQFFNTTSGLLGSGNALSFFPTNCNAGFNGHANYIDINTFEFIDFTISQDFTDCSTEFIDFMNLYINFYNDEITEQFTYTITTETDNSKTLLVTNNNGDTVVYTNTFFNSASQELSNNTWYLHNLIIDGNDNIPPNNTELHEIPLNFYVDVFSSEACSYLTGGNYFDYNLSQFYLYSIGTNYGLTLCNPTYPENNIFTDLYIRDFYLTNMPGPFHYQLTTNNSIKTLTITSENGDQAIYKNTVLSTQEYTNSLVSIYPNPVKDILNIDISNNKIVRNATIYNILGKELLHSTKKEIDVSKLTNGVYVVKIITNNNQVIVKNIIKN